MKLNLGCGFRKMPGYINVDKSQICNPDVCMDLEKFPWPWTDDSVSEMLAIHCLEHLGETYAVWLKLLSEMYRVCQPEALIRIEVPHHRHEHFANDCTHVRVVTAHGFNLFDQLKNVECIEKGFADSPLGIMNKIDFQLLRTQNVLSEPWASQYKSGALDQTGLERMVLQNNNVCEAVRIELKVCKPGRAANWLERREGRLDGPLLSPG